MVLIGTQISKSIRLIIHCTYVHGPYSRLLSPCKVFADFPVVFFQFTFLEKNSPYGSNPLYGMSLFVSSEPKPFFEASIIMRRSDQSNVRHFK